MRKETEILKDDKIFLIFDEAEKNGWKKWGKFYKKKGSSYQCFRQGNEYLWIGFRFIQRIGFSVIDFVNDKDSESKIDKILKYEKR